MSNIQRTLIGECGWTCKRPTRDANALYRMHQKRCDRCKSLAATGWDIETKRANEKDTLYIIGNDAAESSIQYCSTIRNINEAIRAKKEE
jgi:hypothetical protein